MDEYICLNCFHTWLGKVEDYKDWKRRQCPNCRRRQTVKKRVYDRAVDAVTESLESSPPPLPPLLSIVLPCLDVINIILPDPSLAPRVINRIYEEAKTKLTKKVKPPSLSD